MKRVLKYLLFVVSAFLLQCREPFEPDFETGKDDYLVVEGFIHSGIKAVTEIKLSRVSRLGATKPIAEQGATVTIESQHGQTFPLAEAVPGIYRTDSLSLPEEGEYRLRIIDAAGNEYASASAEVIRAPAIDSIYLARDQFEFHIMVGAHGGPQDSKFFSWTYVETWEIRSDHLSLFTFVDGEVKRRPHNEILGMRFCWEYAYAQDLLFASTEQFTTNSIAYNLVTFPRYADRIHVRYSILVSQRAMSEEEYRYLKLMQKNSSPGGSLFDPLPSEIHGNITCINDPARPVIGYVGAYTTSERRKFLLPSDFDEPPAARCEIETVAFDDIPELFGTSSLLPVDSLGVDFLNKPIYTGAPRYCMDCRLRGTPVRPDFW